MKNNPHLKIISLTFILTLTFLFTACADSKYSDIEMVRINRGTFWMGSPDGTNIDGSGAPFESGRGTDEDQHQVTLTQGFYMSKYQVTQKQWEEVMGSNPSNFKGENLPVETVSWYEAIVFCNRLSILEGLVPVYKISESSNPDHWGTIPTGSNPVWEGVEMVTGANGYRLPTEAEWEYACRAGTTTAYNTGAGIDQSQANYGPGVTTTKPVGSYAPNAWGLYDMHGNLQEWCWDWYVSNYYSISPSSDPTGPTVPGSDRVGRGGAWSNSLAIEPSLRSAYRYHAALYSRGGSIGFRLVHR